MALFVLACTLAVRADVTLFVEEPFGPFGAVNPTGHAALYFSRVCATTPTHLRRCMPGETGVVISRYSGIDGYDWLAIPLIPYLYAVDDLENVLSSANGETVDALRDSYRRRHLEDLIPDGPNGKTPGGTWVQLIGASYNRKIYGIEIESSEEQDDHLIEDLNRRKNHSHFNLFLNNCADFSRKILDRYYYPHSERRSFIADAGIMTPKQLASSMVKYGKHHPHVVETAYYIPQVEGSQPRSHTLRGVCEAFIKSKKYMVPFTVLHPFGAAGMVAAYFTTDRFNVKHYAETEITPTELPTLWASNASNGTE
ncbi:MAG TPA: hypothetical protein VF753_09625 [Terriglobales bacterium]